MHGTQDRKFTGEVGDSNASPHYLSGSELLERETDGVIVREVPIVAGKYSPVVCVRVMTGDERDNLDAFLATKEGGDTAGIRAKVAHLTLCDAGGVRLFGDATPPATLGQKLSANLLLRIYEAAAELNYLRDKDMEALRKNS